MSRFIAPSQLAAAHLLLSLLVLLWDLYVAGRTTRLRATPRPLAFLSAVAGLLLVPGLTVLIVSSSALTGRALYTIAWVWPLVTALAAAQAIYALVRGLAAPPIATAIAAYDVLLAIAAAARYAVFCGLDVGESLLGLVAAQAGALAFTAEPRAILTPYFVYLPILAPATLGRRGVGTVLRTALAALAATWGALMVVDLPNATRAVHSYGRYANQRLQERADTDFIVGLKIFPTLTSGPPPLALDRDLALVDSIGAEALSVYVAPSAVTTAALDSIAHSLEDERADKALIVSLDLSRERRLAPAARERYLAARVRDVARIVGRLRPTYVVPVLDPNGAAARALGPLSLAGWTAYLRDATAAARRARSGTRVMVHVGGFGARDSVLYAWAASPSSSADAVGVSLLPWLGGAATLDARMRTVDSWLRASRSTKEHWVLEAGALPMIHGEASQDLALRGILAWATSRNAIRGLIINEASDYEAPLGLRTPSGRMRPAAATAAAAIRELGENRPT